jgi:hypothetical protein
MSSWAERLPGHLLRIIALLHIAEQIAGKASLESIDITVGLDLIRNVIDAAEYFEEHAKKTFGCLRSDGELEDAKYLWNVLLKQNKDKFKKQDVWKSTKGRLTKAEYLDYALRILVQHGYIELIPDEDSASKRGRNGLLIHVNPIAKGEQALLKRSRASIKKQDATSYHSSS